jgi:hypothetical protein
MGDVLYKIRDKKRGLFLGVRGKWTSEGKSWSKIHYAIAGFNSMISRLPKLKTKKTLTKDELFENITDFEIVEFKEDNSYSILFHADKLRR